MFAKDLSALPAPLQKVMGGVSNDGVSRGGLLFRSWLSEVGMPAKDIYHDSVVKALKKDGWTITHDPLHFPWGRKDIYIDLGAEKFIAAERAGQKIAVEVKSFVGPSEMRNLWDAVGQYIIYYDVLQNMEPDRHLYLAVRESVYSDLFEEPIGQLLLENDRVQLVVFDEFTEEIVQWIS